MPSTRTPRLCIALIALAMLAAGAINPHLTANRQAVPANADVPGGAP